MTLHHKKVKVYRKWTAQENARLIEMRYGDCLTWEQIGKALDRTASACSVHLSLLYKEGKING